MNELYKKVFIHSVEDLPKENGTYFVKVKTPPFTQELSAVGYIWGKNKEHINGFWIDKVDWYLIEEPEITDEEIEKYLKDQEYGFISQGIPEVKYTDIYKQFFTEGAKAMRDGLIKSNQK